jgi:hypothetical protein
MSQTISIGVVGPSHWTYMATVMAQRLEKVANAGCFGPDAIPLGVSYDAREFFDLALQAARDVPPANPPASVNAYAIAADLVRASSRSVPNTREDIGSRLEQYNSFLSSLQQPRTLSEEELDTVRALQRFFDCLKEEGEAEAYEQGVFLEPVPVGLRLI